MARWNLNTLRQNMAYMQHETGLIHGSMAENIAWKRTSDITAGDKLRINDILEFVGLNYLSADTPYDRIAIASGFLAIFSTRRIDMKRKIY